MTIESPSFPVQIRPLKYEAVPQFNPYANISQEAERTRGYSNSYNMDVDYS